MYNKSEASSNVPEGFKIFLQSKVTAVTGGLYQLYLKFYLD